MPTRSPSWFARHAVDLALVGLVLAVTVPIVQPLASQQASRMALTAAVWDDGSLYIDGYKLGLDRAEHDGHTLSDKAPGQPFFGIPAYAAYRAVGGEPAIVFRRDGNLGLWAVSVWSCALPLAALALILRRAIAALRPDLATVGAVSVTLGTLLLPFGTVLFSHVLSTVFAFAGWYLLSRSDISSRDLVLSGVLLGGAVLSEYTMALAALAILAHAVYATRWRAILLVAGALPAAAFLLWYQWAAFGSPFKFSYASSTFEQEAAAVGFEQANPSFWSNSFRVLVGERGLLLTTPLLGVAAVGMAMLIHRSRGTVRSSYLAAGATALSLVGVQMAWANPTGGDSPGARYATAAAAFLAPGLALVWDRRRTICVAVATIGAVLMVAAAWTNPLEARDSEGAIGIWLRSVFRGDLADTIYELGLGSGAAGILLPAVAAAAAFGLVRAVRSSPGPAGQGDLIDVTPPLGAPASGP